MTKALWRWKKAYWQKHTYIGLKYLVMKNYMQINGPTIWPIMPNACQYNFFFIWLTSIYCMNFDWKMGRLETVPV